MSDILALVGSDAFWIAVLRVATPLIFGTLGVLLCERAGVLNLGIEGIMGLLLPPVRRACCLSAANQHLQALFDNIMAAV